MRRAPSFSSRPGFPNGLRVLLVEGDGKAAAVAEAQCKGLSYSVASAVGCQEAVCALSTGSFDVVLAEARVLLNGCGQRGAEKDKLIKLIKDKQELPFILMSENPTAAEVMLGIKIGAAEFLEKPLCPLKLKNIWQHTVRRMMRGDGDSARRSSQDLSVCNNSSNNNDGAGTCDMQLLPPSFPNNLAGAPSAGSPGLIDLSTACSSSPGHVNDFLIDTRPSTNTGSGAAAAAGAQGPEQEQRCSKRRAAREASAAGAVKTEAPAPQPNTAGSKNPAAGPSGSSSAGLVQAPACPMPPAPPPAPVQLAPPVCAPGMPWPVPPMPLPVGMAWGMPMNPMAVAPGITPPIFPAPSNLPMPMPAWQMAPMGMPCMQPGMFPAMPLPPCGMPPCGPMPMLPPDMSQMCGPAASFAGACGPAPSQLPPLPMHMLVDACKGNGYGGQCDMQAGSPSCKSGNDVLDLGPEDAAFLEAFDTKLPRCESNLLLPALEDLIADTTDMCDMDMDAALGCTPLKHAASMTDITMLNESLVAL